MITMRLHNPKKRKSNAMENTEQKQPEKFGKFRAFVKSNKTKIIAGFAAIVGWVAGDCGIWDAIKTAIFGA